MSRKSKKSRIHVDGDDALQQDLYPQSDQNAPLTGQGVEIDLPDDYVVLDPAGATALVNKYVSNRRQAKRLADEDSEDFGSRASRLIKLEDFQNGNYEQYLHVDPKSYFIDDDGEEYVIGISPYTSSRKVGYSGLTSSTKQREKLNKRMQEIYDRRFLRNNQQIVSNTLGKIHKRDLLDRIRMGGEDAVKAMQETVAEGNDEFAHGALNVAAFFPGIIGAAARGAVGLSSLADDIRAGRMPSGEFNPKNIRWGSAVLDATLGFSGLGELGSYINPVRLMRYGVDYGYDPYRTYTAKEFRDIVSREAEAVRSNAKPFAKLDKEALKKSGGKPVSAKPDIPLKKFPKTSEQIIKNQNIDLASRAGYRTYKDILKAYGKISDSHKTLVDHLISSNKYPSNYSMFKDFIKQNQSIISSVDGGFATSTAPYANLPSVLSGTLINSKIKYPDTFAISADALANSMHPVGTAVRHAAEAVSHPARSAKKAASWTTKKLTPLKRLSSLQNNIKQSTIPLRSSIKKLNTQKDALSKLYEKIAAKSPGTNMSIRYSPFHMFHLSDSDRLKNPNPLSFSKASYDDLVKFLKKHYPNDPSSYKFTFRPGANGSTIASANKVFSPIPPFVDVHSIDVPIFGSHTSTGAPVSSHLNFSLDLLSNEQLTFDLSTSEGAKAFYQLNKNHNHGAAKSLRSPGNLTLTFDPEANMVKAHNIAYIESVTGGKVMGTTIFKNVPFKDFDVFTTENIIRSKFPKEVADELIDRFREKMNSKSGFTKIEYQLDRGPNGKSIYGKYGEIDMNCIMSDPKTGKATGKLAYEFWRMADPQGYSDAFIKEMVEHPNSKALPPIPYTPDELLAMTDPITKSFIDSVDAEFIPEMLGDQQDKVKFAVRSYGYIAYGDPAEVSRGIKGAYRYFIGNDYQMAPRFSFDNPAENLRLLEMFGFPYDISNNPAAMQNFFDLVVLDSSIFYRGLDDISDLKLIPKGKRLAVINQRYYNRYSGGYKGTANGQGINTILGMGTSDGVREKRFYAINGQIPFNDSLTGARTPTEFVSALKRSFGFTPFTKADYDFVMSLPESERTVKDIHGIKTDLSKFFTPGSQPGDIRFETDLFKNNPDNWDAVSNILKKLDIYFCPGGKYSFSTKNDNGPIYASMVSGIPGPKLYSSARGSRSLIQRTKYAFTDNTNLEPYRLSFKDNDLKLRPTTPTRIDNPARPTYEFLVRNRDRLDKILNVQKSQLNRLNDLSNVLDSRKDDILSTRKRLPEFMLIAGTPVVLLSGLLTAIVVSDQKDKKSYFYRLLDRNKLSFDDCMNLIINSDKDFFSNKSLNQTDFKSISDLADNYDTRVKLISIMSSNQTLQP